MPASASSIMSMRARPDRNGSGMFDSPQTAPANCPQIASVVSASSPRLTARRTASDGGEAAGAAELDGGTQGVPHGQPDQGPSAAQRERSSRKPQKARHHAEANGYGLRWLCAASSRYNAARSSS